MDYFGRALSLRYRSLRPVARCSLGQPSSGCLALQATTSHHSRSYGLSLYQKENYSPANVFVEQQVLRSGLKMVLYCLSYQVLRKCLIARFYTKLLA